MSLILSGTDGLSDVDGTAATPAIRGTDANTGIFFPAADTIAFSEGGAEAMRINSSGNVGIGTASPTGKLNVDGGAGNSKLKLSNTASGNTGSDGFDLDFTGTDIYITNRESGFMAFENNGAERMRIDSSGNVGIGTSSPSSVLNVKSSAPVFRLETTGAVTSSGTASYAIKDSSGNDVFTNGFLGLANCYQFATTFANGFIRFLTGSQVEALRITSAGVLLVGRTTQTSSEKVCFEYSSSVGPGLTVNNSVSGGGTAIQFSTAGSGVGNITTGTSSTSYNTSSDYRLKNTITSMTGALAKVALLKPVTYKWNIDGSSSQGFIAHELQEVVPDCVNGEKDAVETYTDEDGNEQTRPKYQGIDTSFLVATLTAAIQEQQALITALTARITALETPEPTTGTQA